MLNIKYNGSKAKAVFNGINLTFGNTGLVFICGKKESSAKTLVKYLAGVEYVEGLEITVDDFVLNHPALVDDYRLYNIGLVFANTQYIENETVFANVLSSCATFQDKVDEKYIHEVLERVGLLKYRNSSVSELSEYQLHCLDIARALVKDPKVIIANNPIARLNAEEVANIWKLLKDISKEYLVFVGNALQATAKEIADQIVAFEAHTINHVQHEQITVTVINESNDKPHIGLYVKENKFSFKNLFKISSSLLRGSIYLMVLLGITISLFLITNTTMNNDHENFARALHENEVNQVTLKRNIQNANVNTSDVIDALARAQIDFEFPELTIQWGYNLAVSGGEFKAHVTGTGYTYPAALFRILESEKDTTYELLPGSSWEDEAEGIYISETEASKYLDYINNHRNNKASHNKKFRDAFDTYFFEDGDSTEAVFNSIEELVGEKLLLSYNKANLTVLPIAGIFKDNEYKSNLIITDSYDFGHHNPDFDQELFFSIGLINLTDDYMYNSRFIERNASVIRNERENLIVVTSLDSDYSVLFNKITSMPTPVNVAIVAMVILTIAGSVILSYLLIANYRKELTLSRSFGLSCGQIMRVSALHNLIIGFFGYILSLVFGFIVVLICNAIFKSNYDFMTFGYFQIPLYSILIGIGIALVFSVIFTVLSHKALKKHDYLVH